MNFANGAQTTLASSCTSGAATISVVSALAFPAAPFHIVVDTELMTVTLVIGTTFTVTRGIEGSGAQAHAAGAVVTNTVTAGDFAGFGSGGTPGDMIAALVNAVNSVTNPVAATLVAATANNIKVTTNSSISMPIPAAKKVVLVKVTADSTALLTINPNAGETINFGLNTQRIMWADESATFICLDGANWDIAFGVHIPMIANISLTINPTLFAINTLTKVLFDTLVGDNTNLIADLTNSRLNVQRSAPCDCNCYVTFDPTNGLQTVWGGTTGAQVDILNNAGAGGATWTTAKGGALPVGTSVNVVPVALGTFPLVGGQFIAGQCYCGNSKGNANNGPSGSNCGLGLSEKKLW
jgi:hypothetical protein